VLLLTLGERRALRLDVRDALTSAITQGYFKPGERVVESRVARELGVSQTTVREALRELESTGLVVYSTNRGCVVRELSAADVAEMYDMRALLEGEAARRATGRLGPADLDELDRLVDEMIRLAESGSTSEMIETDVRFHRRILTAANHQLLVRLWTTINPAVWTHLAVVGILRVPTREIAGRHRAVVEALRTGDPARAQAAMSRHLLELRDVAESRLTAEERLRRQEGVA
jgi:DNA-binding GntR family transcriptional regulator